MSFRTTGRLTRYYHILISKTLFPRLYTTGALGIVTATLVIKRRSKRRWFPTVLARELTLNGKYAPVSGCFLSLTGRLANSITYSTMQGSASLWTAPHFWPATNRVRPVKNIGTKGPRTARFRTRHATVATGWTGAQLTVAPVLRVTDSSSGSSSSSFHCRWQP